VTADLAAAGGMQAEALDTSLREGVEALAVDEHTVGEPGSADAGKDDSVKIGDAAAAEEDETTSPDDKTNNGAVCRIRYTIDRSLALSLWFVSVMHFSPYYCFTPKWHFHPKQQKLINLYPCH